MVENLRTSSSQLNFFREVADEVDPARCVVQHLKLRDARLSDHAWRFLTRIHSLRQLDLTNTAVPGRSPQSPTRKVEHKY